jgi:hypothetical protein
MWDIEWFLTGRGWKDNQDSLCAPPRDYEFEALRHAKIWGYFGDEFDGMLNLLERIEPWIKKGTITPRICEVMRRAEKRFLEVRLKEIIEVGERMLKE